MHNALRMDKVTLLLVQNVAAADILIAILFYFPAMVSETNIIIKLNYALSSRRL